MYTVLIAMVASNTLYGKFIRFLTQSRYNHVMVIYRCPFWDGWWALQVDEHGARPVPVERVLKSAIRWKFFTHETNLLPLIPTCRPDMDRNYDYLGIFGFLLKILIGKWTGLNIRNLIHKKNEVFCSEFTTRFFRRVGIEGADKLDPPSVSPGDLAEFCEEGHGFQSVRLHPFELYR